VWSDAGPVRYERLTWPEVARAAGEDRALLEAAVTECVAYVDELLAKPVGARHPPVTGS
jgi:hypothetical protein